jgi:hypothetical protein
MSEELKPCPCGGQVYVGELKFTGETQWHVGCINCNRESGKHADKAEAIAAWNRRASPTPEGGGGERDAFEVWAHADHRRIEPEEYEERTPDNNHYYADDSTNQAYVGWCAALLSSPRVEDVRRDALEEAATVADETQASAREEVASDKEEMGEDYDPYSFGAGFLSGEITASINIGTAIRSLSPPDGDGKQEQATRASGPTAPTDLLQSKESYK